MDLHNLYIAGLDRVEPDPREEYRDSIIKVNNVNLASLRMKKAEPGVMPEEIPREQEVQEETAESVTKQTESQKELLVKNIDSLNISLFVCGKCQSKFKR